VNVLNSYLDYLSDLFTGVAVNDDDPFVDEELFRFKLDLDRFKHLDRTQNLRLYFLAHHSLIRSNQQQELLQVSLYLSCKRHPVPYHQSSLL
jgi:hypothetical protein